MEDTNFYQHIDRLSLFYSYFVFLDTDAYLADQLFIKHQVRVHFHEEYVRGDSPYRAIFCHVRKRDRRSEERSSGRVAEKDDVAGLYRLFGCMPCALGGMSTAERRGGEFP